MKLRLAILGTLCIAAGLSACGDPVDLKATAPTTTDTLTVYALAGTPPSFPSALAIPSRQAVRVDGFGAFDVAFDINGAGQAVLYPLNLVVTVPGGGRAVGLQKVPGAFDDVATAPRNGYVKDSALVVSPGEVVAIEAQHNGQGDVCGFQLSPFVYAKITIDRIDLAVRTLTFRLVTSLNCGFRSFAPGIPTS